jgi:hypothetical protein
VQSVEKARRAGIPLGRRPGFLERRPLRLRGIDIVRYLFFEEREGVVGREKLST